MNAYVDNFIAKHTSRGLLGAFVTESNARHAAQHAFDAGKAVGISACLDWFEDFYRGETWVENDLKLFRKAMSTSVELTDKEKAVALLDDASCHLTAWQKKIFRKALTQND